MRQKREQKEEQKRQDQEDRQMLAYTQRMPAEQRSAFMYKMKEDNLERATRLQARLTQRRQ
ncbi:hypothetical protein GJ744_006282 [Endocarpon pusillum]|uniref:Uncharacterized protein n=1 Tax=Endocarpon pusillum TaxID=364733 RepID=A0A8H7A7W5_9EURO|nr:hypothetical protein GJ744_006282 [Endocarpon pusillum]